MYTKNIYLIALLAMLAGVLVHINAVRGEFVYDDTENENIIRQYDNFSDAFKIGQQNDAWVFRPTIKFVLICEKKINDYFFGVPAPGAIVQKRAIIPHVTSLLIHALSTGLVVLLAAKVFSESSSLKILMAGLVFSIHPMVTENVSWIAAKSDGLATAFLLASLLLSLIYDEKKKLSYLAASGFIFLMALQTKEIAFAGLFMLPGLRVLVGSSTEEKQLTKRFAPEIVFVCAALLYLFLRFILDGFVEAEPFPNLTSPVMQILGALALYIKKTLFPWPLQPFIYNLPGIFESLVFIALLFGAGFFSLREYQRGNKIYLVMLVWFFAALGPSLVVAFKRFTISPASERYLYLPLVSYSIVFASIFDLFYVKYKRLALATFGSILLLFASVSVWATFRVWNNNLNLITTMVNTQPGFPHPMPFFALAGTQLLQGRYEDAKNNFMKVLGPEVIQLPKYQAKAYDGLGQIELELSWKTRDMQSSMKYLLNAEKYFSKAWEYDSSVWLYKKKLALSRIQILTIKKLFGQKDPELLGLLKNDIDQVLRLSPGNPEISSLKVQYEILAR